MKSKNILKTLVISLVLFAALLIGGNFGAGHQVQVNASRADAYDLSSWQGRINDRQARGLKNEVSFVILRAQYGQNQDTQLQNSMNKMNRHNIPYGVYSYSMYHNNRQARNEATSLYSKAPQANFYINDIEQNNAGRRIASATKSWADQMKRLTTKPIALYSSMSFIQQYLRPAKKHYNAIWVAAYSKRRPVTGYKYDLWQYSSTYYSRALGKKIDASKLTGNKPLSFWIGSNGNTSVVKPVQPVTSKATHKSVKKQRAKKSNRGSHWLHLSRHETRRYHHEMNLINRKFRRGDYRLSRTERKALKMFQARHGHAYQI